MAWRGTANPSNHYTDRVCVGGGRSIKAGWVPRSVTGVQCFARHFGTAVKLAHMHSPMIITIGRDMVASVVQTAPCIISRCSFFFFFVQAQQVR